MTARSSRRSAERRLLLALALTASVACRRSSASTEGVPVADGVTVARSRVGEGGVARSGQDSSDRGREAAGIDTGTKTAVFDDRREEIHPSEETITRRRLSILSDELRRYQAVAGHPPATLRAILSLEADDPFLLPQKRWLVDGWGRAFRYTLDTQRHIVELRSRGPDGEWDSADDMVHTQSF